MKQEHTEQIDRYFNGLMEIGEQKAFEKEIEKDPELKAKVLLHHDLIEGMHYHFNAELKSKLNQSDQENNTSKHTHQPKGRHLYAWLGVAAAVSFFFLAGYFWYAGTSSPENLYQAYYEPYPNIINPSQRSANPSDDHLSRAMRAYEMEEYQSAIQLFQREENELSSSYQFYLAICFLETSDYQQSISRLEEVIQSGNKAYELPSLWYQSMAYLADGNTEKAREILQGLSDREDTFYSEKATKLLQEL